MNQDQETAELLPLNTIRAETVLSRFPIHRLSKRGHINIEIKESNPEGELKTRWKVSYNSEYGQPGPLEYKLDTIFVNRKIEEAGVPIPVIIKLGSRHEIAAALGLGRDTNTVKKALLKNASAFVTLKRTYTSKDGAEKNVEAAFTRYSLIFTGEKLPDGRAADAVYLILNEIYRDILNTAQTRPLDYDYLKELSPGAQRFYELLSYQIFAALRNARPRAKMLYSYYCTRAPQTRYLDYDHVKKQMYKLHAPHKKSGYISAVELRETTDGEGQPDWEMLYTPGQRAKVEFREATRKNRTVERQRATLPLLTPAMTEPAVVLAHETAPEDGQLLTKLMSFQIAEPTARELVRDYRRSVELQLRALPHRNLNKIRDLASWLVVAIKESHQLPEAITDVLAKEEEVRKAQAKREAAEVRHRDEEARSAAYFDFLRGRAGKVEKTQPEAYRAFLNDSAAQRAKLERNPIHKGQGKKILLRVFDDEQSHLERYRDYFNEPSLEEWLRMAV
jgi:hypothetical protein